LDGNARCSGAGSRIALPETLADGSPFPQRNLIVSDVSVILVTLVRAGADAAPLIRALGLRIEGLRIREKRRRKRLVEAALAHLEKARRRCRQFGGVHEDSRSVTSIALQS